MSQFKQLSFSDMKMATNRKVTRTEKKLHKIENILNFEDVIERFSVIDKTKKGLGGRPRKEILMMTKILFVQYLYNLSDPELEDQLNDGAGFLNGHNRVWFDSLHRSHLPRPPAKS